MTTVMNSRTRRSPWRAWPTASAAATTTPALSAGSGTSSERISHTAAITTPPIAAAATPATKSRPVATADAMTVAANTARPTPMRTGSKPRSASPSPNRTPPMTSQCPMVTPMVAAIRTGHADFVKRSVPGNRSWSNERGRLGRHVDNRRTRSAACLSL